jgi:hypothetical protein
MGCNWTYSKNHESHWGYKRAAGLPKSQGKVKPVDQRIPKQKRIIAGASVFARRCTGARKASLAGFFRQFMDKQVKPTKAEVMLTLDLWEKTHPSTPGGPHATAHPVPGATPQEKAAYLRQSSLQGASLLRRLAHSSP